MFLKIFSPKIGVSGNDPPSDGGTTPLQSPSGQWRLMEDRKGKPGRSPGLLTVKTEVHPPVSSNTAIAGKWGPL